MIVTGKLATWLAVSAIVAASALPCGFAAPAHRPGPRSGSADARPAHAMSESPPAPAPPPKPRGYQESRYNRVYGGSSQEEVFNQAPNAFLLECLDRIAPPPFSAPPPAPAGPASAAPPPGDSAPDPLLAAAEPPAAPTAIDIGMGSGRNALALAQRGFRVTGIDISEVGVEKARARAAELGLELDAIVADVREFDFGVARWDVIVLMYFWPQDDMDRIKQSLKPGGHIIIEDFSNERRGELTPEWEPQRNTLLKSLLNWDIVVYEHDSLPKDWYWHGGPGNAWLLRVMARKS